MKFTIIMDDEDILAGITWAREQDNANPGRKEPIVDDAEFVQIECGHLLKQYARGKVETEARALASATIKAFDDAQEAKAAKEVKL